MCFLSRFSYARISLISHSWQAFQISLCKVTGLDYFKRHFLSASLKAEKQQLVSVRILISGSGSSNWLRLCFVEKRTNLNVVHYSDYNKYEDIYCKKDLDNAL